MHRLSRSIEINAPIERVFEFVTTPTNLPSVWPSMVDVSNVKRSADGRNSFDWTYKMAGMPFKGHSETTEVKTNALSSMRNEGGIPSTFRWTFEKKGAGTLMSCEVEYTIPAPLIGRLAEMVVAKINEHEMEHLFANIKTVTEMAPKKDTLKDVRAHH